MKRGSSSRARSRLIQKITLEEEMGTSELSPALYPVGQDLRWEAFGCMAANFPGDAGCTMSTTDQAMARRPSLGSSLVIRGVPWEVRSHTTKCLPTEVLPYGVQRRGELRSSRPFLKRDFLDQAGSRPTGAAASCSALHSLFW